MGSCVGSGSPPVDHSPSRSLQRRHSDQSGRNSDRHSHHANAPRHHHQQPARDQPRRNSSENRSYRAQPNDERRRSPNPSRNERRSVSSQQQQDDERASNGRSQAQLGRFKKDQDVMYSSNNLLRHRHENANNQTTEEDVHEAFLRDKNKMNDIFKGMQLDQIVKKHAIPSATKRMDDIQDANSIFLIEPFTFDISRADAEPRAINHRDGYVDQWDDDHVRMPCSPQNRSGGKKPIWPSIVEGLQYLKKKCDARSASFNDLKKTIYAAAGYQYDLSSLEEVIENIYNNQERAHFMSIVLSKICELVLRIESVCTRTPPLLRSQSNKSVTMSQRQAASLLACAFFCLFPDRSSKERHRQFERFPNPNFNRLYERGSPEKLQKLKCILHYFTRVTGKMPNGVITFQRFALHSSKFPLWKNSRTELCELALLTGEKIEDIPNALQVDFANKYIGGGVLGNGCVQEEIRFAICPEMLVSLLLCEVMEDNECVFLIGCERYSKYKGYAQSFQFDGDFSDGTSKDNWGRRLCHLVAIDAIFFRDRTEQYHMRKVERELLKAYVGFRPMGKGAEYHHGIATGNWGCGVFNGDKQLKAIIQLMAASEAQRPLIYASFADRNLAKSFSNVYDSLRKQQASVSDLYYYLQEYSRQYTECSLFEFIIQTALSKLRQ